MRLADRGVLYKDSHLRRRPAIRAVKDHRAGDHQRFAGSADALWRRVYNCRDNVDEPFEN